VKKNIQLLINNPIFIGSVRFLLQKNEKWKQIVISPGSKLILVLLLNFHFSVSHSIIIIFATYSFALWCVIQFLLLFQQADVNETSYESATCSTTCVHPEFHLSFSGLETSYTHVNMFQQYHMLLTVQKFQNQKTSQLMPM
jgi:hypothetical protein